MVTLTGKTIANTYKDLLQVSNSNSGVDATLRDVSDGEGTASSLKLSTVAASFSGTMAVTGVSTFGDDLVSDTDSTDDLGTTSVRWANLWVDAITITGALTVGSNISVISGSVTGKNGTAAAPTYIFTSDGTMGLYRAGPGQLGLAVGGVKQLGITTTLATFEGDVAVAGTAAIITSGAGTPEASITAPVGSLYMRTDGGASTSLYVKESGAGNTGWVAK